VGSDGSRYGSQMRFSFPIRRACRWNDEYVYIFREALDNAVTLRQTGTAFKEERTWILGM
jgi:hypothetical protein